MSEFTAPGTVEIISIVNIRKSEPREINWTEAVKKGGRTINEPRSNYHGKYQPGTKVKIVSIQSPVQGETWGRLEGDDPTGKALWICLKHPQRTFAKMVMDIVPLPVETTEERLEHLETEFAKLLAAARGKGWNV